MSIKRLIKITAQSELNKYSLQSDLKLEKAAEPVTQNIVPWCFLQSSKQTHLLNFTQTLDEKSKALISLKWKEKPFILTNQPHCVFLYSSCFFFSFPLEIWLLWDWPLCGHLTLQALAIPVSPPPLLPSLLYSLPSCFGEWEFLNICTTIFF